MSDSNPSMDSDKQITIRVGERLFTTRLGTLTEGSPSLAAKFSARWNGQVAGSDKASSEPLFLDADGEAFAHVLEHMRNGSYPLLWDGKDNVPDVAMYGKVAALASYLLIEKLAHWIEVGYYGTALSLPSSTRLTDK